MENNLELKKEGENYRVSLYYSEKKGKPRGKAHYWNIISRDKKRLAQILLDLYLEGFPIDESYRIMQQKIANRDWTGL